MHQQNNKIKGYDSEDGIGVVYDARDRSTNRKLYIITFITTTLLFGAVGYIFGLYAGENQININEAGLDKPSVQYPDINFPRPQDDIPSVGIQKPEQVHPPYTKPRGGIFIPNVNVFSAGNGLNKNGELTPAEIKRLKEAKTKCEDKRCCREDDDVNTDSSECKTYGYLKCLAADNACVWDCSLGHKDPNDLHYIRKFKGIDRHDAYDIGDPKGTKEADDKTKDKINPDLMIDTADECGTLYEFHLDENSKQKEKEKCGNNPDGHEQDKGSDAKQKGRRSLRVSTINVTEAGEANETIRRKLGVLGTDGRRDITSWTWPFYKVVWLHYETNTGDKMCSGALVSPRHVLTAGHCVSDGSGNWYWGWKAFPAYNAGNWWWDDGDYFTANQAWTFTAWHSNNDWNYDIAIVTLHSSNTGYGWFGFGWDTGISSSWHFGVAGYPNDKGETMQAQSMYMDRGIAANLLTTNTGDIVKGNSGGPAYYHSNTVIYGVTSHEVPGLYNAFARITQPVYDAICSYFRTFSETSSHC